MLLNVKMRKSTLLKNHFDTQALRVARTVLNGSKLIWGDNTLNGQISSPGLPGRYKSMYINQP